ncbi:restriction endonuclease subunit S [Mycobacterium sp. TY815]|uniref:restriction endonuclease subunit S n=1 Tax=Mycobacterium sp. TY815 TaxID=3050581 RepID=UPI00274224EC|nr:restriction endonuclease subunit S [Mycobacterium sp. TY815]MDP7704928.1 restriction endonuclease subunit S [Mycobacterium sp. TY815]
MNFSDAEMDTFRLKPFDILLNEASGSPGEVGKPAMWRGELDDCGFQNTLLRVRPGPKTDPDYLLQYFRYQAGTGAFARGSRGVGIKHLGREALAKWPVPLPPIDEQRRIATVLDLADDLRHKRSRVKDRIDALAQAIFTDMFGDPFENERQWPTKRIDEVALVQLGRQRSPKYQTGQHTRPYLRVANVYEDRLDLGDVLTMDFNEKDFAEYVLRPGDILLNEGQSTELVGRPAMFNGELEGCCFQNTLLRVQVDTAQVCPGFALGVFLDYFRRGRFARLSSKTSSVAHLGKSRFASMKFPLPDLDVQAEYCRKRDQLQVISESHRTVWYDQLLASLQSRAFSGQL